MVMYKLGIYFPSILNAKQIFGNGKSEKCRFDKDGVICNPSVIAHVHFDEKKIYHNPNTLVLYTLANYNMLVETKQEVYKNNFFRHVDWLLNNYVDRKTHVVWVFDFEWRTPGYYCKPPWISAMAQGLIISALLRAYEMTKEDRYIDVAKKAVESFDRNISEGGVLYVDKNDDWWYEEYACQKRGTPMNGFIFSLLGLYEFYKVTGDEHAKYLFDKGIKTVKKHLNDYIINIGFFKWSKYDNKLQIIAPKSYHDHHVAMMLLLHELTGDEIFLRYYYALKQMRERYGRLHSIIFTSMQLAAKVLRGLKLMKS
ncbi:MAG: D-glucuronyl C5-epimerase family protein [Thermoplasmatales archaeon]|nr:D-glucuronyl C5-epimerase family protein [Thermoplasmatales archaeon]